MRAFLHCSNMEHLVDGLMIAVRVEGDALGVVGVLHHQQLLFRAARFVQLTRHECGHHHVVFALHEQDGHLGVLHLIDGPSLVEVKPRPVQRIPLADPDDKCRRDMIEIPDLALEGLPGAGEAAVADCADDLRGEVALSGGAQYGGAAHGYAVEQYLRIFAEAFRQIADPADAVPAVLGAHGDVFPLALAVSPVIGEQHAETDGLVELDVRRELVPRVGLEAVDAHHIFVRSIRRGEQRGVQFQAILRRDINVLVGQRLHVSHARLRDLGKRPIQVKRDIDVRIERFARRLPLQISKKSRAGLMAHCPEPDGQQNDDCQHNPHP